MDFRTQFDEHVRFFTEPGDPIKILYGLEVDKKGVTQLVEKGKYDLYEYIQSHADSVDIHKILERFQNGDIDALNKYQGYYGDITEAPKSFADALNSVIKAKDLFNSLPLEVRARFDHSPEQFIAALGTDKFNEAVGLKSPTLSEDVEKAVETVENVSEL